MVYTYLAHVFFKAEIIFLEWLRIYAGRLNVFSRVDAYTMNAQWRQHIIWNKEVLCMLASW